MFFSKAKVSSKPSSDINFEWLIVGLGNPKPKYFGNRHNIGWSIISKWMEALHIDFFEETKKYALAITKVEDINVLLCHPLTYMNLSGEAVIKIMAKYKIPIDRIVILVDEYNFPVGKIHIKQGGSDGGHNGITSILDCLQNDRFIRMRLGIDRKFGQGELVDYVLADFKPEEIPLVEKMKDNAIKALKHLVCVGFARAASDINSGKLFEPVE